MPRRVAPPFFSEVEFVEPSNAETPEILNPQGAGFGLGRRTAEHPQEERLDLSLDGLEVEQLFR